MNLNIALNVVFLGLVVWLIYEYNKHKNQQVLNNEDKVKDQLKSLDNQINTNDSQAKQDQQDLKNEEKKDVSEDQLIDYLNRPNK